MSWPVQVMLKFYLFSINLKYINISRLTDDMLTIFTQTIPKFPIDIATSRTLQCNAMKCN